MPQGWVLLSPCCRNKETKVGRELRKPRGSPMLGVMGNSLLPEFEI